MMRHKKSRAAEDKTAALFIFFFWGFAADLSRESRWIIRRYFHGIGFLYRRSLEYYTTGKARLVKKA